MTHCQLRVDFTSETVLCGVPRSGQNHITIHLPILHLLDFEGLNFEGHMPYWFSIPSLNVRILITNLALIWIMLDHVWLTVSKLELVGGVAIHRAQRPIHSLGLLLDL